MATWLLAALAAFIVAGPSVERWVAEKAAPTPVAPFAGTEGVVPASLPGPPGGLRTGAIDTLPALVDAVAPTLMAEQHAPGTALAIVHGGRLIALRAYGHARLDTNTQVDAARTLFRIGSVTKPLTAAAVLQLVDDGRVDLFRDVRQYLPALSLPYAVTTHQLLTHTAALDETFAGTFTRQPQDLEPLAGYLQRTARSGGQPGLYYSYAGTNYAVAGWLIEQMAGVPYADAMRGSLFGPLQMTATTARQPPDDALLGSRARGYAWDGARYQPLPFRYIKHVPGGGVSTTAGDMGRFMLALLGDGSLDGVRVLSPASRARLLRPQFRDHPSLPGVTYGFHEWRTHGRVLLHHDGTLDDQVGVMLLDPDNGFGLFVASNSNPGIGNHLLEPVLTHLYGPATASDAPVPLHGTGHAAQAAGVYLDLHRTRHDLSAARALMPMLQARVDADGDAIAWGGRRWDEVAPFVFQPKASGDRIVFRGEPPAIMQTWNSTYERIGWTRQTPAQVGFAVACVTLFLMWTVRSVRSWRRWPEGRAARACAIFVASANLLFVVWLGASFRGLGDTVPLPAVDVAFLTLGVAAATVAVLLPGLAVSAWRRRWWTRGDRAAFTVLAASAVAFAAWLNAWNLLGFRY